MGSPPQAVAAGGGQLQIAADTADGVFESVDGVTTSKDALNRLISRSEAAASHPG